MAIFAYPADDTPLGDAARDRAGAEAVRRLRFQAQDAGGGEFIANCRAALRRSFAYIEGLSDIEIWHGVAGWIDHLGYPVVPTENRHFVRALHEFALEVAQRTATRLGESWAPHAEQREFEQGIYRSLRQMEEEALKRPQKTYTAPERIAKLRELEHQSAMESPDDGPHVSDAAEESPNTPAPLPTQSYGSKGYLYEHAAGPCVFCNVWAEPPNILTTVPERLHLECARRDDRLASEADKQAGFRARMLLRSEPTWQAWDRFSDRPDCPDCGRPVTFRSYSVADARRYRRIIMLGVEGRCIVCVVDRLLGERLEQEAIPTEASSEPEKPDQSDIYTVLSFPPTKHHICPACNERPVTRRNAVTRENLCADCCTERYPNAVIQPADGEWLVNAVCDDCEQNFGTHVVRFRPNEPYPAWYCTGCEQTWQQALQEVQACLGRPQAPVPAAPPTGQPDDGVVRSDNQNERRGAATLRRRGKRPTFDDSAHFSEYLCLAMRELHGRGDPITRPAVAELFRSYAVRFNLRGLRSCDDRRIREWCSASRYNVDFDAIATEIEGQCRPSSALLPRLSKSAE